MPELTNRKTGARYAVFGGRAIPQKSTLSSSPVEDRTFRSPSKEETFSFADLRRSIQEDLKKAGSAPEQTKGIMRELQTIIKNNHASLRQLFADEALVNTIHETLGMIVPRELGIAGILLSLVTPATAQATSGFFTPHSGRPSGGSDLCPGNPRGCTQGFTTTNGSSIFNPKVDSQFKRTVYAESVSKKLKTQAASAYSQIIDCFDNSKMGNIVAGVRNQTADTSSTLQVCTTSTGPWRGYYSVNTITTNVPSDMCPILQQELQAAIIECQDKHIAAILEAGKIAGIVLGSAVGLALIIGACFYLRERCNNKNAQPNNQENMTAAGITLQTFGAGDSAA